MVGVTSGWISWFSFAAGCVSGGFWIEGSSIDVLGVVGSGKGGSGSEGLDADFGLGSGGGDGEWSGVIGVVGIWSVGVGSSTCGGESSGS